MSRTSRRQTRRLHLGPDAELRSPTRHNQAVRDERQHRPRWKIRLPLAPSYATSGSNVAPRQHGKTASLLQRIATDATMLGMDPEEALAAAQAHHRTHPDDLAATRAHVFKAALDNALHNSGPDSELR